jgi:quercetin dioxygenase-like cupin family protein
MAIVSSQKVFFSNVEEIAELRKRRGGAYSEFLRVASMSAGLYVLAAGSADSQSPHEQDELYYVLRGKARMRAGTLDLELAAGSLIFVAAHAEHHFYDIEEEITLLVFFAPAETSL